MADLYNKVKDAIVDISVASTVLVDGVPLVSPAFGAGFFIGHCKILTCAHLVLLPEDLQRVPSSTYSNFSRNQTILATVFNVNGCDRAYRYNVEILAVDRSNDLAVLLLMPTKGSPKIDKHPILEWSSDVYVGQKVYTIGNPYGLDLRSLSSGIVRNNKYIQVGAPGLVECISIDINLVEGNAGGPLLDREGRAIGIVSAISPGFEDPNGTIGVAIASWSAYPIVEQLIDPYSMCEDISSLCKQDKAEFETILDPFGSYLRLIKPATGLSVEYINPLTTFQNPQTLEYNLYLPLGTYNQITGAMVIGIPSSSTLAGVLELGDIITAINGIKIGQLDTSFGQALLDTKPGQTISIRYRTKSSGYKDKNKILYTTIDLPIAADRFQRDVLRPL